MSRLYVNINPKLLKWARDNAGYETKEIANKIDSPLNLYENWERTGTNLPLGKLNQLANEFKRQLAFFFLPEVPTKKKNPKDFRNLNPLVSKLSKRILLCIRNANHFQDLAYRIEAENHWEQKSQWIAEITENILNKNVHEFIRSKLSISLESQIEWGSESEAYKNWRNAIESKLGILVFQFSMPLDEVQGFCLTDSLPYVIVTNSNHPYTGRIFTLFHELAHIINKQSAICLVDGVKKEQKEEWLSNSFAGKFLAPTEILIKTTSLSEITKFAHKLRISREAYLRRLNEEGIINGPIFFSLLDSIKSTYKAPKKNGGFVLPERKSLASRGETFYSSVLNAAHHNTISYTQASNALGLSISRILNA